MTYESIHTNIFIYSLNNRQSVDVIMTQNQQKPSSLTMQRGLKKDEGQEETGTNLHARYVDTDMLEDRRRQDGQVVEIPRRTDVFLPETRFRQQQQQFSLRLPIQPWTMHT